jgi:4-alpha-glucanotransferase
VDQLTTIINELATLMEIEAQYTDIWGKNHPASLDTKLRILESMGIDISSEEILERQLSERRNREWTQLGPSVWVTYVETLKPIPIQLAAGTANDDEAGLPTGIKIEVSIEDEEGWVHRQERSTNHLEPVQTSVIMGVRYYRYLLQVPRSLAPGYYTMRFDVTNGQSRLFHSLRLILCPEKAYLPPALEGNGKTAGVQVSLYGLRSSRNWGIGDFTDLKALTDWTVDALGGSIIGLNPLMALYNRTPYNHCPYQPISRLFRNFIYLDVEAVAGFPEVSANQIKMHDSELNKEIESLRASPEVSYEKVAAIKNLVLKEAFQSFLARPDQDAERNDFQSFLNGKDELLDLYATFMALCDHFGSLDPPLWGWPAWPPEYHDPSSPAVDFFKRSNVEQITFYKFLQWEIERQLDAAERYGKSKGLTLGFYHDMPLAVDNTGLDAWMHRELFAAHMSTGAPPDPFSPNGQDWGVSPPLPEALAEDEYAFFIRELRSNMRPGSALRLDHAMRFFRLFWIPEGSEPLEGAYVRYKVDDLVGIMALESVRNRTLIIAEDLGTVPPIVRKIFARRGIFSYRLVYFEKDDKGDFKLPQDYPEQALVSISTHDLPTFEGYWSGLDIEIRHRLGKFDSEERYQQELHSREADKARLLSLFKSLGLLPDYHPLDAAYVPSVTPELHNAVVGFVACTCSKVLVIDQEDILRDDRQQNLPGTSWEIHNWMTKMSLTMEELVIDPRALGCAHMVRNWIETTGRGGRRK